MKKDYGNSHVKYENKNSSQFKLILIYLAIWVFSVITFWFFTNGSDALGYGLVYIWVVLPVTTFVISLLIGKNNCFGRIKWFFSVFFGIMYMLLEYATFSMANNLAFNKVNVPEFSMISTGMIISLIGMLIGYLIFKIKKK